ncbi:MAG: FtsQ-type POTRA domain-containing protein [Oscillospiraceae bacterium]|jgi:cell division septal protein FtsQ|nr:FtsQ-type POTRA domain-containing protein [Oscillospiraceae bacterium]
MENTLQIEEHLAKKRRKIIMRKRRKRNRIVFRLMSLFFFFIAVLAAVYFSLGFFLKVERVIIENESRYTNKQIIEASKVKINENIFGVSVVNLKRNIEKKLLFVENVIVKKKFPVSILIIVHKSKPAYAVKTGEKYVILSEGLKILDAGALTIDESLDIIDGVKLEDPISGEKVDSGEEVDKLIKLTELRAGIKKSKLRSEFKNIKKYDLSDPQNVKFFYRCKKPKNQITVKFGNFDQMPHKIKFLEKMIDKNNIDEEVPGEIDLTDLISTKRAIWKPLIENIENKGNEKISN